ncbi:MAG: hypothetical protein LBK13_06135 [Spirochaetales bacterium]|jgi:hypothetical protein|nr:hypothetical protein [Spirochaetales bacterium]
MKKNYTMVFAAGLALIALCVFWGCDSSDDDDSPSPEEQISITGKQVYGDDGSEYRPSSVQTIRASSSSDTGASYAALTLGSIDTNGNLTLNLPAFTQWSEVGGGTEPEITADPQNVRVVMLPSFIVDDGELRNIKRNGATVDAVIVYTYADKDAHIYGTTSEGEVVNLTLKKGWNSVIKVLSGSKTMTSGSPDAGFKWEVWEDD